VLRRRRRRRRPVLIIALEDQPPASLRPAPQQKARFSIKRALSCNCDVQEERAHVAVGIAWFKRVCLAMEAEVGEG